MSDNTDDSGYDQKADHNPQPISPIVIVKTKNFKSYRKPKLDYRNIGTDLNIASTVWPKSSWFDPDCDRQKADNRLRTAKNGTFIIRKSSGFDRSRSYAMSLAHNNNVYHCLINRYSNGFGFDTKRIFSSLEDLVLHYKEFELLLVHNRLLDLHLAIPGLQTTTNQTSVKLFE